MLTQAIKRWFHRMFAWWPRSKATEVTYVEAAAIPYRESTQGTISHATIDGTTNQTSSSTVQPKTGEWTTEQYILPPNVNEAPEIYRPVYPRPQADKAPEAREEIQNNSPEQNKTPSQSRLTSTQEQLEFLYYLVKNGVINEGFDQGEIPEQYRLP